MPFITIGFLSFVSFHSVKYVSIFLLSIVFHDYLNAKNTLFQVNVQELLHFSERIMLRSTHFSERINMNHPANHRKSKKSTTFVVWFDSSVLSILTWWAIGRFHSRHYFAVSGRKYFFLPRKIKMLLCYLVTCVFLYSRALSNVN